MADPDYVQLPSDALPDNKNKIRSFSVIDDENNTVLEQVSVLADADGNLLAVTADSRPRLLVRAPHQQETLDSVLRILKEIKAVLIAGLGTSSNVLIDDTAQVDLD